jgi:hypothetical protein
MPTETVILSKNSTNLEISNMFKGELADGQTRIFAMNPSENNSNRITLFMCQQITTQTNASDAQKFFLGWGEGTRILRAVFSAEKVLVNNNNLNVGSIVPFDILVEEKTVPAYDNQNPKINPSTGEVIMHNNLPVYEHSSLVPKGSGAKVVNLSRTNNSNEMTENSFPGANLIS